jgi:hypothetical protein
VPDALWKERLVSSRLLEYEVWNQILARGLAQALGNQTQEMMDLIEFTEMRRSVLSRALEPFPVSLRTLDSLHLASLAHLHTRDRSVVLASYDKRIVAAAESLAIALYQF